MAIKSLELGQKLIDGCCPEYLKEVIATKGDFALVRSSDEDGWQSYRILKKIGDSWNAEINSTSESQIKDYWNKYIK